MCYLVLDNLRIVVSDQWGYHQISIGVERQPTKETNRGNVCSLCS